MPDGSAPVRSEGATVGDIVGMFSQTPHCPIPNQRDDVNQQNQNVESRNEPVERTILECYLQKS